MANIQLSKEAVNCLDFWQQQDYGKTYSEVILQHMKEWLNRQMTLASSADIQKEFENITKGK